MGEQGIESMHAIMNTVRGRAIRDKEKQLKVLMKEQHIMSSPDLLPTPPKKRKQ
jgi:hypothetical protein